MVYDSFLNGEEYTLLSLRDKKGEPHVTIDYDEEKRIFKEIKGKGNTKPVKKYHKYIVDIIIFLNINGFEKKEYDKRSNFSPNDLDDDLFNKLMDENPTYQ